MAAVALGVARGVHGDGDGSLHPFEHRLCGSTVNRATLKHSELGLESIARADVLERLQEFSIALIGLMTKLVAGETQDSNLIAELLRNVVLKVVTYNT